MFTRYFQYADVHFYTLWSIREIALRRTGGAVSVKDDKRPPSSQQLMAHATLQHGGEVTSI
jgi:hypothetical protein